MNIVIVLWIAHILALVSIAVSLQGVKRAIINKRVNYG